MTCKLLETNTFVGIFPLFLSSAVHIFWESFFVSSSYKCLIVHLYIPVATASVAYKVFLYESSQLVSFKVKLHFHVKTSNKFFTVLMPLSYGKLFWICFFLLFFCSCLIVCSKITFSESLCYTGTSQFISVVRNLSRFCLMWSLTELNFQTHLRAIFVLCVLFYNPAFAIIYLTATPSLLMFWVIKRVSIHLFPMLLR